ncbi:MAG: hypothetical protein H6711_09940 [Myxococcales bacterium]|nr:hypothetical protein [Myxococcales bacterium]
MAKKLCLGAIVLLLISLVLPWHHVEMLGIKVTQGIFVGDETKPDAYLIIIGPLLLAALLGALVGRKRFGRGLGIGVFILALLSGLLIMMVQGGIAEKGGATSLGGYLGILALLLTMAAGLIGTVKPEKKA